LPWPPSVLDVMHCSASAFLTVRSARARVFASRAHQVYPGGQRSRKVLYASAPRMTSRLSMSACPTKAAMSRRTLPTRTGGVEPVLQPRRPPPALRLSNPLATLRGSWPCAGAAMV
jgi:hypothetical protein